MHETRNVKLGRHEIRASSASEKNMNRSHEDNIISTFTIHFRCLWPSFYIYDEELKHFQTLSCDYTKVPAMLLTFLSHLIPSFCLVSFASQKWALNSNSSYFSKLCSYDFPVKIVFKNINKVPFLKKEIILCFYFFFLFQVREQCENSGEQHFLLLIFSS